MTRHRSDYKRYNEGKKVCNASSFLLFDEFGVENCKIELIEYCKSETKDELVRCEGDYIKNSDCVNKQVAGRTKEEYRIENRDYLLTKKKEYAQIEYTCDVCNKTLRVADKSKHEVTDKHINEIKKQRELSNEETENIKLKANKLKERKAHYYNKNKESIIEKGKIRHERKKEVVTCECGKQILKHNLLVHQKSTSHQQYLKSLENQDD